MPGTANGWSVVPAPITDTPRGRERVLATPLAGGGRLLVSDDLERIGDVSESVLQAFGWTLALVLLFGVAGGLLLSRGLMARIDGIGRTAEAIIDGDLTRRAPVGRDDELGHLARTINRMLDRIEALMDSLKQVSNDIAHDLRTPLTRVRQRLESALTPADEAARTAAIEQAIAESDGLMATFEALLRISQVEAGARRSGFRKVDLGEVARTVVDAYAPSAEDQGAQLSLEGEGLEGEGRGGGAQIDGDRDLLVQMLANLIENALAHAGLAPAIQVRLWREGAAVQLAVRDDGPGVPRAARDRVLERFYRLENSRTTPGNGLGLSLVRAVTRLHGGALWLEDAAEGPVPGLCVRMSFPAG